MKLEIPLFDEEKLREIVREHIEKLKEDGWLYRDISNSENNESVRENKGNG